MRGLVFAALVALMPGPASLAAQEARFGGTFIGAVVAEDGIVLASDSRSTFQDADRRAWATWTA